jgi:DNA-binding MarR family transcriptional regulator
MKNNFFSVEDEKDSLGFMLWQITTLWQKMIKEALKKYKITHPQFVVLASLLWFSSKKEVCNQVKLSKHTKIDKVTIGGIIENLQNKNLIERKSSALDRRSYEIVLSKSAFSLVPNAVAEIENIDNLFFKKLTKQEKENFKKNILKLI